MRISVPFKSSRNFVANKGRSVNSRFLNGFWRCLVLETMPNPLDLIEACVGFCLVLFLTSHFRILNSTNSAYMAVYPFLLFSLSLESILEPYNNYFHLVLSNGKLISVDDRQIVNDN